MEIKQSVKNTFNRVGIDYVSYLKAKNTDKVEVKNWITGVPVMTSPLIRECIEWVYRKQLAYEQGDMGCRQDDFDRIRYFVLAQDNNAYMTCLD